MEWENIKQNRIDKSEMINESQLKDIFKINIEVKNYWGNEGKREDRFEARYYIHCPCGHDRLYSDDIYLGERNTINENDLKRIYRLSSSRLMTHIENQIRMNGSKFHIDLLIQLLGQEEALKLLEYWAKKNMFVALALKEYIERLKNKPIMN